MSKAVKKESASQKESEAQAKAKESKKKDAQPSVSKLESGKLFVQESWAEFRKIQWPTLPKAINQSLVVLATVTFLALLVTSWTFYHTLADHKDLLFPMYALTGLCVGIVGAVPFVMVRAFPPVVRFSGLSFSYNLAYAIFGGLTPMAVTWLLKESAMGPAYYVAIICSLGMLVGLYLWKKGR